MTSLVVKVMDKATKEFGMFKASEDGLPVGGNLKLPARCRICDCVMKTYKDIFHHNTEFQCVNLSDNYELPCPICTKASFKRFEDFNAHVRLHNEKFYNRINYLCRPVGMDERHYKEYARYKAVTMLWTVQLFKKIIEVEGANSKPFLPAISYKILGCRKEVLIEMCHWPMCVSCRIGTVSHTHPYEFHDLDGKCKGCKNYHHFRTQQGTESRTCLNDHYQGNLPS